MKDRLFGAPLEFAKSVSSCVRHGTIMGKGEHLLFAMAPINTWSMENDPVCNDIHS